MNAGNLVVTLPLGRSILENAFWRICAMSVFLLVSTLPGARAASSIWVHDGDDLGRLDFSTVTTATFTYIGKFGIGSTGPSSTAWGDAPGATSNTMLDIAWNPLTSTLYGISSAQGSTNAANSYLWTINPLTAAATLVTSSGNNIPGDNTLPGGTSGVDSFTLTNALGFGSNGSLLTAINTDNSLFALNPANNTATNLGGVLPPSPRYYSSGDIDTYLGKTYMIGSQAIYTGGDAVTNYLIELNLANPAASSVVGALASPFDSGYGLGASDLGLYAFDGSSKTVSLINPLNAALTPVSILGSTAALSSFSGAAGISAAPEPTTFLFGLALLGVAGLSRRCRC